MTSNSQRCPLCGQANLCRAEHAIKTGQLCWCFSSVVDPAAVLRVPIEQRDQSCLCHACATRGIVSPDGQ